MRIIGSIDEVDFDRKTCLTLGVFDGFHLGHQKLMQKLLDRSGQTGARSVIMTFHPHPRSVVGKADETIWLITPVEEKVEIIRSCGPDILVVIPFSESLAGTGAEEFIHMIMEKIGFQYIFLGHNHAFGKNRAGGEVLLERLAEELGFSAEVIPPVLWNGKEVSSTRIRRYLLEGRIGLANSMLGRKYTIYGTVIKGEGRGKGMGFPTANIDVHGENKLIPADGVYAVRVMFDSREYPGMAYIGTGPTFDGTLRNLEVHLLAFNGDLFGQRLKVVFHEFIRVDQKFESVSALINQMQHDRLRSIELLENN